MKVAELITALSALPQNATVLVENPDAGGYETLVQPYSIMAVENGPDASSGGAWSKAKEPGGGEVAILLGFVPQ